MDTMVLDFESFFSQEYSLTTLTTEAYVRGPQFETILVGIKINDTPAFWVLHDRFLHFCQHEVDWSQTIVIMHHAAFDGLILSHHYGAHPYMFVDTLSMSRILRGPKMGHRLEELAKLYSIGVKGDDTKWAKGKHLADFSRSELIQYGAYCTNDCELTYDLAQIFLPQMPAEELQLVSLTVKMFTQPTLIGDAARLKGAVASERQRKIDLLRRINLLCPACGGDGIDRQQGLIDPVPQPCPKCDGQGVDKKTIGSNEKLVALFRACGVEPETKTSPTTGEQIWAFAKTDPAMQALLEDEYEDVRFLAEARLAVKSNIIETRAEAVANMAARGPLCIYLNYGGAHTMRWSGGGGCNFQNLSNHNEARPELAILKQSIQAPPGHVIVAADSAQGEARILAWLAGQQDLVQAFADGRDVYSEAASAIYNRKVDRKRVATDKVAGFVGKVSELSMGFGVGYYRAAMEFAKGALGGPPTIFTEADIATMGIDPSSFLSNPNKVARVDAMPSRLPLQERLVHCLVTDSIVTRYRQRRPAIVQLWKSMDHVIDCMIRGEETWFGPGGLLVTGKDFILMPNGLRLNFRGIERSSEGDATYFDGRSRTKVYTSLLVENLVQCLHRIIVGEQMLKIAELCPVVLMTHDEIVTVVPEDAAELTLQYMIQVMATTPDWAPGLPLAAEGGTGLTYAGVK